MGREIRNVPPQWDHPITQDSYGRDRRQPMYKGYFEVAAQTWLEDFDRIRAGNMTELERECYPKGICEWVIDNGCPDPKYYRTWADANATWFQVWETVSEGTPVSPPFATEDELVEYLAANGDYWDQKRGDPAWGQDRAERFVKAKWAPSFVFSGGTMKAGTAAL